MAYSPGYSIDIRADGDTVRGAFEKYNAEVVKIYGILNTLDDKDITAAELENLKNGDIDGERITGNVAASRVSGALTQATIASNKVTGLETFVRNIVDSYSSSSITELDSDHITLSNGLILQWGSMSLIGSVNELAIGFAKSFSASPCVILSAETAGNETVTATLKGSARTTGFTVIFGQASGDISRTVNYIAIGV